MGIQLSEIKNRSLLFVFKTDNIQIIEWLYSYNSHVPILWWYDVTQTLLLMGFLIA